MLLTFVAQTPHCGYKMAGFNHVVVLCLHIARNSSLVGFCFSNHSKDQSPMSVPKPSCVTWRKRYVRGIVQTLKMLSIQILVILCLVSQRSGSYLGLSMVLLDQEKQKRLWNHCWATFEHGLKTKWDAPIKRLANHVVEHLVGTLVPEIKPFECCRRLSLKNHNAATEWPVSIV